MKRIGVLTSGGDAPGMNAAIRAVTRTAIAAGVEVYGFNYGYDGLLRPEFRPLISADVAGVISRGGTFLRSSRSMEFREYAGREKAAMYLQEFRIEGLLVIGGDGSLRGADLLCNEFDIPVMGIPGSIDNDIPGTDYSIGFDTAVNTAVEAIDRVRDTAYSHDRVFVVEVMGRHNGFIALEAGLASGAEAVVIPEMPYSIEGLCQMLKAANEKGKRSNIVVVAEGAARATDLRDQIHEAAGIDARYLVLGHMQRGGAPSAFDRILALRLGAYATQLLLTGQSAHMVGVEGSKLVSIPFPEVLNACKVLDPAKLKLVGAMSI